jgi:TldD protein
LFDLLERAVEKGQDLGASYVELRGEEGFIEYIQMDDLRVNALTQRIEQGVAVRVLADGAWGFVSMGDLGSLDGAVENAYKMAKAAAPTRREPIALSDLKAVSDVEEIKVVRDPRHVPIEEKIGYMESMTKVIKGYDPRITAVTVKVRSASGKKYLATSDGTRIQSDVMLVWSYPWVTGREGDRLSAARHEEASTTLGWEYFEDFATPEFMGEEVARRVKLQLGGTPPKAGSFPCVIGPRVVGTLAHEALGHLAEADLTVNSAFNGKMGEVVASEGVTMIDDGTLPGNVGTTRYDDEGVPTSKVELIKESVLTGLLTNREYAAKLGLPASGNARAESYLHPPIIRMRSTFFETGEWSHNELFEGIDFGYYCLDMRGGQAQMNASFQVGIQEAYEIVDGELGNPVTDLSISGIATDSLFKIEGISKDAFTFGAGRCGKGQEAFISDGGPNTRFLESGITFGGQG